MLQEGSGPLLHERIHLALHGGSQQILLGGSQATLVPSGEFDADWKEPVNALDGEETLRCMRGGI